MKSATVVLLQAVVATYVASVVGVGFLLGPYAIAPAGLAFAFLGLLYAVVPGVLGLIGAYFWIRGLRGGNWLKATSCVLWGALAGFLWALFAMLVTKAPPTHYGFKEFADFSLGHIVPGAVGGLIFWLLTRKRIERYTEAMAHDPHP